KGRDIVDRARDAVSRGAEEARGYAGTTSGTGYTGTNYGTGTGGYSGTTGPGNTGGSDFGRSYRTFTKDTARPMPHPKPMHLGRVGRTVSQGHCRASDTNAPAVKSKKFSALES